MYTKCIYSVRVLYKDKNQEESRETVFQQTKINDIGINDMVQKSYNQSLPKYTLIKL